jgi:signal transduction histidine kinase
MVGRTAQLSRSRRPKWHYLAMGVALIVVAVVLTVAWQVLAAQESAVQASRARAVVYVLGSMLSLLLIAGLVLIVLLLIREVRLNERQSNFVSAVTHELKTPVASLKLYLDTLEYREVPPERRAEFYRTMRLDIDRLNTAINGVLNAAMYTDRPIAEPCPLDLARLVRRAVELTVTRYQLPADAVSCEGPPSLRLSGDAQALETAVLNLLDNAVKYSKDKVRVEVEVWGDGDGQAHVRVRDHGIGMSRTHLPFIFTRFYRIGAEVRRSRTGTGLGLFIVRSIVKGHRGSVTADSPGPDRGSTFTLSLPGVLDPDPAAGPAPEVARV